MNIITRTIAAQLSVPERVALLIHRRMIEAGFRFGSATEPELREAIETAYDDYIVDTIVAIACN